MVNHYVLKRFCLLIFLWLSGVCAGFSETITSKANGSWSDADTWEGGVPKAGDVVSITHTVAVDQVTQVIGSLEIKGGGELVAGTGISELRLAGALKNDGILNLYSSPASYAGIVLSGGSHWSGAGTWNVAGLQLLSGAYWTFTDGIQILINKDLQADETAAIYGYEYPSTELIFTGPESSTVACVPSAFYPILVVDKDPGAIVSFPDCLGFFHTEALRRTQPGRQ